ncbi:alpha/beta fold hydrolase [Flexivirga sp. ID2601S]|uniref:Alpha/beta fold hydrolase n=1 Tax=Flexivirga aerilata TaxID=1656889 RepID=A0A849AEK4_9MICO|nr:alpha/beta hydrolase [Flexivirga aerilata]NNG38006.1 alpha/beta fold hydrolase [Flexivirga aerilata]
MRRLATTGAAAAAAIALTLAGCSSGSGDGAGGAGSNSAGGSASASSGGAAAASSAGASAAGAPASLAKFYGQKLDWKDCGPVECAKLTVPVDYSKPDGATIQLAVDRVKATGKRKGALVVNPGGPGASGYDYAAYTAEGFVVSKKVASAYDVVGFDPRGVQRSAPITCVDDKALDGFIGSDPTPDTAAEEQQAATSNRDFGTACQTKGGPLVGHVSTVEVAKDVDVLRAALGEDKLNYLGKSYGTFIGSTYAGLFPQRVGRFVLDGVVPPDITSTEMNLGQAKGFEQATQSYVRDCVAQGGCPLGDSVDSGMARIRKFLKDIDAKPLPVSGNGDVKGLTEGWATIGIAQAMYEKSYWPDLTDALKAAFGGDGNKLMKLANSYAERNANGSYSGNIMQAINAVNCLDRSAPSDLGAYRADAKSFAQQAPTWGPMLAWGSLVCGEWPIKATGKPGRITAAGSGPILVVGTTRDPATPYEWSKRLADQLQNGHLLTYDGDGHTAYLMGSGCVDDSVDGYLLDGTVPAAGKAC